MISMMFIQVKCTTENNAFPQYVILNYDINDKKFNQVMGFLDEKGFVLISTLALIVISKFYYSYFNQNNLFRYFKNNYICKIYRK